MSAGKGGWRRPRSLRTQLLLWLITLHLAAAVLTAWFSFLAYGNLVHNALDDQMRLVAESYAGGDQSRTPRLVNSDAVLERGAFVVQIWSPDGSRLLSSSWPDLPMPLQPRPGFGDLRTGPQAWAHWRAFTAEPGAHADQRRVQVLQNEDYRRRRALRRALLEGLPITLLLPVALLALWLIVSAASRSLRAVARDVASQDERSPTDLPLARVPDEIAPLVASFNHLLGRVRSAFATQRRFVQDAAHELRTPMAAIGLQIENLRAHIPAGEATERFVQLEAGVTRAQHLIEQLLSLSRQDAPRRAMAREAVDIEVLLRESVSQLMVLAGQAAATYRGAPAGTIGAGSVLTMDDGVTRIAALGTDALGAATAWQSGRIVFNGMPLDRALAEFNRYLPDKIVLGQGDLGATRLGGEFRVDDPDTFLLALREAFDIDHRRQGDQILLFRAR